MGDLPRTTGLGADLPLLERWGLRTLVDPHAHPPLEGSDVHVLDAEEQRALRRIERGAVARAAFAGVLSAVASGVAEVLAGGAFRIGGDPTLADLARYWGVYGAVTLVASVLEIAYLYWDALVSVRALAGAAGLRLHAGDDDRVALARSLARAALELPDDDGTVHGVDPLRESSRVMLVLASLVYKAKTGVSSFLFKALVRRALGRFATRQLLAFAAVPVNAAWNAWVTHVVMREARVRVMGPSAIAAYLARLPDLSHEPVEVRAAYAQAVGSAIVRTRSAHPNLVRLLREVVERVGPFPEDLVLDDSRAFVQHLRGLPPDHQRAVSELALFAAVLDGRLGRAERRLVRDVLLVARDEGVGARVEAARRAFLRGKGDAQVMISSRRVP